MPARTAEPEPITTPRGSGQRSELHRASSGRYGSGRDLIRTAHLTPTPKGSCIQWTPQAVELVLVLPDDNSHGTEKSAAKGWESAPWGGAIENGQHERKDRACKAVSVALRDWRTPKVLA